MFSGMADDIHSYDYDDLLAALSNDEKTSVIPQHVPHMQPNQGPLASNQGMMYNAVGNLMQISQQGQVIPGST